MANRLPWLKHKHDARRDPWLRAAIRKSGHIAGWVFWGAVEVLHEEGRGDTVRVNPSDFASECITTIPRLKKVLSVLHDTSEAMLKAQIAGKTQRRAGLHPHLNPDLIPQLRWKLVGNQIEIEIKNFRIIQENLRRKTASNRVQNAGEGEGEGEGENLRGVSNEKSYPPASVDNFADHVTRSFRANKGEAYPELEPRDYKHLGAVLAHYGDSGARALWDTFIVSKDRFILKAGHTIPLFATRVPRLLDAPEFRGRRDRYDEKKKEARGGGLGRFDKFVPDFLKKLGGGE